MPGGALRSCRLALGALMVCLVLALAPSAVAQAPVSATAIEVVQTDYSLSQYLKRMPDLHFSAKRVHGQVIHVNDHVSYQRFRAIGAAMTDSSAWLIYDKLDSATRASLMEDLFTPAGIDLGFLRVPIGASDFTMHGRPYSYDDMPSGQRDPHLRHFSIAHDRAYIIPALRSALSANPNIWMLANPWSAPGWMKANDSMNNRHGSGTLLTSSYGPFAQYFVDFLMAYAKAGLNISAITPQNEPDNWTRYPGMELHQPQESRFIRHFLRPALRRVGLGTRIYGNDSSWDQGTYASNEIGASGGLAGIAWHCYKGSPSLMSQFHHDDPALNQVVDECSPEIRPFSTSEFLISTLRNWATTVSVWNLALNPDGGPVQPPNSGCGGCNGVVTINPRTHRVTRGLKYFQLGQVGRFVHPGARRIGSGNFVTYNANSPTIISSGLDDVAFRNPDGSDVLIAFNSASKSIRFGVDFHNRWFSYSIPPLATTTFVWR